MRPNIINRAIVICTFIVLTASLLMVYLHSVQIACFEYERTEDSKYLKWRRLHNVSICKDNVLEIDTNTVLSGTCDIFGGIHVKKGITLVIDQGSKITMSGAMGWISNEGNVLCRGTKKNPIQLLRCAGIVENIDISEAITIDDFKSKITDTYIALNYVNMHIVGSVAECELPISKYGYEIPDFLKRRCHPVAFQAKIINIHNSNLEFEGREYMRCALAINVNIRDTMISHTINDMNAGYYYIGDKRSKRIEPLVAYIEAVEINAWRVKFENIHAPLMSAYNGRVDECAYKYIYRPQKPIIIGKGIVVRNSIFKDSKIMLAYASMYNCVFDSCQVCVAYHESNIEMSSASTLYCIYYKCSIYMHSMYGPFVGSGVKIVGNFEPSGIGKILLQSSLFFESDIQGTDVALFSGSMIVGCESDGKIRGDIRAYSDKSGMYRTLRSGGEEGIIAVETYKYESLVGSLKHMTDVMNEYIKTDVIEFVNIIYDRMKKRIVAD